MKLPRLQLSSFRGPQHAVRVSGHLQSRTNNLMGRVIIAYILQRPFPMPDLPTEQMTELFTVLRLRGWIMPIEAALKLRHVV